VARFAALSISLVTAPLLARALSPSERGEVAALIAVLYIAPIALGLGISSEIRRRAVDQQAAILVRTSRLNTALLLPLAWVMALVLSVTLLSQVDSISPPVMLTAILFAPLTVHWMSLLSICVAEQRFRVIAAMVLTLPVVNLSGLTAFTVAGGVEANQVIVLHLVGSLLTAMIPELAIAAPLTGPRLDQLDIMAGAVKFAGASLAEAGTNRLDQAVMLLFVTPFEAGQYSISVTIGSLPVILGQVAAMQYFKAFGHRLGDLSLAREAIRGTFSAVTVVAITAAVLTPVLLPSVFGQAYSSAVPATLIMLCAAPFAAAVLVSTAVLTAWSRPHRLTTSQLTGVAVNMGVIPLAAILGALGMALAAFISYVVVAVAQTRLSLGLGWRIFVPSTAKAVRVLLDLARGA